MIRAFSKGQSSQCVLIIVLASLVVLPARNHFTEPDPRLAHLPATQDEPMAEALPLPLQHSISRQLGHDDPVYHFSPDLNNSYLAVGGQAAFEARLTGSGMEIRTGSDRWTLALKGWGRGHDLRSIPEGSGTEARANQLEVVRGPMTEWYVNGPFGLQQGWIVAAPPPGMGAGPLTLLLEQGGNLLGQADGDRRGLSLVGAGGVARLRYTGLLALDAAGQTLRAWLEVDGTQVWVRVDDTGITYPVLIDPWIQAARLTASDGADGDALGSAVAMSADGSTVVLGAPHTDYTGDYPGAAYVYVRPESGWADVTQTAKLIASDGADDERFGCSVAVSADGTTVVIGAYFSGYPEQIQGAVYVYVRPETGWVDATETAKLTTSDGEWAWFGHSVGVSADGSTVVAGAPQHTGYISRGAAFIYVRPELGWADAFETAMLTASDAQNSDELGYAVAISADGGTVVAGLPGRMALGSIDRGAAYVYVRPASGWTDSTQTARLNLATVFDFDGQELGRAVAVSMDGGTVFVGAPGHGSSFWTGRAYVYERPAGGWVDVTETAELTNSDGVGGMMFGRSVAVTGDGAMAVAGALTPRVVYMFQRPAGGWTSITETAQLTTSDGHEWDQFGAAAAVSEDGDTVIAGAPGSDTEGTDRGAAYVFTLPVDGQPALTASPSSLPADGTSASTVTLSHAPPRHRVRLISSRGSVDTFDDATGKADSSGQYVTTIRSSTPGTAIVTAEDLTTGRPFAASATVLFTPVGGEPTPPTAEEGEFVIRKVDPRYDLSGSFLTGFPSEWALLNPTDIHVDWKAQTPGHVDLLLNGELIGSVPATEWGASYTFDMNELLLGGENLLEIVAYNADGFPSTPWNTTTTGLPPAGWLVTLIEADLVGLPLISGKPNGDAEIYIEIILPPDPYEARVDFGIHGEKTGISPTQFVGRLDYKLLSRKLGVRGGLQRGGVQLMGRNIDLKGLFGAEGTVEPSGSIHWQALEGEAEAVFKGNLSKKSLLVVINAIPAVGSPIYGTIQALGLENWMKRYAWVYVDGELKGIAEVRVQLDPEAGLESLAFGPGIGLQLGARIYVKGGVEFHVYGGAGGELLISYPPMGIERIVVEGKVGYEFKALWFKHGGEGRWEWVYPEEERLILVLDSMDSGFSLLGHGYSEPYSVFHGSTAGTATPFSPELLRVSPDRLAATVASEVLVSNVYTYTQPSLALNGSDDSALLLWVHDDVDKPLGQNFDLAYSYWDGSTWATPERVTDDTYLDGAPQAAWDSSGNGLVLWQRLNDPAVPISATWDVTTAQKVEIATAVYSPTASSWSSVTLLTNNTALDMQPELARNADGDLLAAWRQNDAGLLGGTITDTDRIVASFYDSGWGTSSVAVDGIPGLVDMGVGYGDGTALIAYTRHITPTGWSTPTLQLLTSQWDGVGWSAPSQQTDDALGHHTPQVVYSSANEPLVIWLAGEELRLQNLSTGTAVSLTLPAEIGNADEFRAIQDGSGNIAAVFTAQSSQRDIFVSFYDQAHNLWGRPVPITGDRASERYPSPAPDSTGRLLMGYTATAITSITQTTTISDTGEVVTFTVPVEGQTDLLTLSHVFTQNLTLGGSDLMVSDSHPTPGASVVLTATVRNSGDLALDGVEVGFYDGAPDGGGLLIGTSGLSTPLAGGYTATLTTTYGVPATGGGRVLYAVADPADAIVEADETDNAVTLAAFGPDLELGGAGLDYWGGNEVGIVSLIRNLGTTTSPTTTLGVRWETITGTLAVTDTMPSLAAGETLTLTTPWDYGFLGEGSYPLVASVNTEQMDFSEVFTANNSAELTLQVLSDLAVSPYYLWTDVLPDGRMVLTGTLYNFGSTASGPAPVEVWLDEPFTDTQRLSAITLPGLEPAGSTIFTATWDAPVPGRHSLYVGVDSGWTLTETTRANNLASIPADVDRLSLAPGWNLVSSPLFEGDPDDIFDHVAGRVGRVHAYAGCRESDPWKIYDAADPGSSDLVALDRTRGYWIEARELVSLTLVGRLPLSMTVPLCAGWNLAGYPSQMARPVAEALASIDGKYTRVLCYDTSDPADPWKQYDVNAPPYANDLLLMEPGEGYWLYVTEDCTWTIEP